MYKSKLKGFSLVELIIAIGIFTLAMSSFAFLGVESYRTLRTSQSRIISSEQSREIADLIMLVKTQSWGNIVDNTDGEKKHIINEDGFLSIGDGEKEEERLSYFFTINRAYRDTNGNLVDESMGVEDPSTRVIDLTIIYEYAVFGFNEFNTLLYINNWNTFKFSQETKEDFDEGSNDGTEVSEDGKIVLEKGLGEGEGAADWCKPELTHSVLALDPRSQTLTTYEDNVYIVRGEHSAHPLFAHVKVIPPLEVDDDPELENIGFFNPPRGSNKATNLYYSDGYVYTANPNEAFESVWIIDVDKDSTPLINYSPQVGWYDIQGSVDASTIYVQGDYGFVGYDNKIDVFDVSEKTGNRSRIGSPIQIGGTNAKVKDIFVQEDYIFVAMTDYTPLVIVDISNVNNPTIVGEFAESGNTQANTVFISEDSNRAYLGTNPEFFVIDISDKSAPFEIGSFDTGGMNITTIGIIEQENRAVLGGSGSHKYIVLNLDDLELLEQCGELDPDLITGNVLALDVVTYEERLFTYILTRSGNDNELQIIEGGPGEGGAGGIGDDYIEEGVYESSVFIMLPETRFYGVNLYGEQPEGTTIRVQLRVGVDEDLSSALWFGPDGTESTYFLLGENEILVPKEGQYFQYKVEMSSTNPELSPVLDKIEIIYD